MKSVRAPRPQPKVIELKGTALQAVAARLRSSDPVRLAAALEALLGGSPDFFCGEAALLDCTALDAASTVEWRELCALMRRYRLNPVAARVACPEHREAAQAAGLVVVEGEDKPAHAPAAALAAVEPASETLVVDRPLRSGQQIYARGGDLIVLAMVNTGAEVIADGNIHVYAPLRGRALAGARGNAQARIFTTCLEAELVSIAGVYRVLENGPPPELKRRPAQVRLRADEQSQQSSLTIEPLSIG
ncbi:MAG: septum site-determining protein MinC [Pseudomonadota bacterium]|jgi:septum site-determining protein MinC